VISIGHVDDILRGLSVSLLTPTLLDGLQKRRLLG
jgi:hypothetical protein